MSPFPQSVVNSSAFSTVFLVPSPVAIVLLIRVPKESRVARMNSGIKCPEAG